MAVLFKRVPLAASIGLSLVQIACAEPSAMAAESRMAEPVSDPPFTEFSQRPSRSSPPLRLTAALHPEAQHIVPQAPAATTSLALARTGERRSSRIASPEVDLMPMQGPGLQLTVALSDESRLASLSPVREGQPRPLQLAEQVAPAPEVSPIPQIDLASWDISTSDRTLNATLERWSSRAGWQLIWDMELDYPITTGAILQGSFEDAIAAVARSLADSSVPIQATFYKGNRVLRIIAKGSE